MSEVIRITVANDRFQLLSSLLTNRTKRHRQGEFIVQGVRPIGLAVAQGWTVRALISAVDGPLSNWAQQLVSDVAPPLHYELTAPLLHELSQRDDPAELLAVVESRLASVETMVAARDSVIVGLDRPQSPGNLGSILRSCDALAAAGLVVIGHAVDPFDPASVRASTGSVFSVPVALADSMQSVLDGCREAGRRVIAFDEAGAALPDIELDGRALLLFGNERRGLSRGTIGAADAVAAIPMQGTASSLNLASSVSIALYEAARRGTTG